MPKTFRIFGILIFGFLSLLNASAAPSDLKVLVLIPEQVIRRVVPDPAAETEIQRVLIASGFRVVDVKQTDVLRAREDTAAVLRGGSRQALVDLGLKFNADVLITGEAFAEEIVPIPDEIRANGLRAYLARLEVKGVDLATGQLFLSAAYTGSGIAAADFIAGKTALEKTAAKGAPEIARRLREWEAGKTVADRVYNLKVTGLPNYKAFSDLVIKLKTLQGVKAVKARAYDEKLAEIEISFTGAIEILAGIIDQVGLNVTNQNSGEIRAAYTP